MRSASRTSRRDAPLVAREVIDDGVLVMPAQGKLPVHDMRAARAGPLLACAPVDVLCERVACTPLALGHISEVPGRDLVVLAAPVHAFRISLFLRSERLMVGP